jgi:hypothetical protein
MKMLLTVDDLLVLIRDDRTEKEEESSSKDFSLTGVTVAMLKCCPEVVKNKVR